MTDTTLNTHLVPFEAIDGVFTHPARVFADDRGSFAEMFRMEWFPMANWENIQMNRSVSKSGVLRGLHYHHHQVDYWILLSGRYRVGLADLRPDSPTYMTSATIDLSADDSTGLFIPIGVAHGFYAITDVMMFYVVNQYYNGGKDENGVAWNDPELGVDWQADNPVLSDRDQQNRLFADIPADERPR